MSATRAETTDLRTERSSPYPAEKARQGQIILKTTWAKTVFMTGLFGGLVIVILVGIYLATLG